MSTVRLRSRPAAVVAVVGLTVAGALALTAGDRASDAVAKDETFMDAETVGVTNIEGGDCFSDPTYSEEQGVEIADHMDCERADNQAYGFFQIDDDTWDHPSLVTKGWDGCRVGFSTYWKTTEASGLDFYPVLPTERTWDELQDRTVMCVVYNPEGQLLGSPLPTQ